MKKINKVAKRIGESMVLNKLTLKEYHDNFNKDYQIFKDDGITPLEEDTMGYMLYSEDAGKHWFVSEKYFKKNLEFIGE